MLALGLDDQQQRPAALRWLLLRPDCERVRVDGGAAPTVLQGRPRGHEANPLLSSREGTRAEPARRPGNPADSGGGAPRARHGDDVAPASKPVLAICGEGRCADLLSAARGAYDAGESPVAIRGAGSTGAR